MATRGLSRPEFEAGDQVDALHGASGKHRRSVVLRISDNGLLVVAGTGSYRDDYPEPHVLVKQRERGGIALRLDKDTYYRQSYIFAVSPKQVQKRDGRCPVGILHQLQALMQRPEDEQTKPLATPPSTPPPAVAEEKRSRTPPPGSST